MPTSTTTVRAPSMTIAYSIGHSLYLNITNRCSCNCVFCIRRDHQGVGTGDSLWLARDPSAEEVIHSLEVADFTRFREIVFCGYGEPTERLEVLLETCRYLREQAPALPIRLNTNGLAELRHGKPVAQLLEGLVDVVSISLNAPDAQRYLEVTRPGEGATAFDAMLRFAAAVRHAVPQVLFSVVDILSPEEIRRCQELADSMGIPLRVRTKS